MSALSAQPVGTWFREQSREEGMVVEHAPLWQRMIDLIQPPDLRHSRVLDYGCNRGGFLQALYALRPYRHGIGTDIAAESLAYARQDLAGLPVDFAPPDALDAYTASVDCAFSHEVLYLLPDLDDHAALLAKLLKPGAVYYAAIGCHTGNPLWPLWRDQIAATANLPAFDYSLDDYTRAFQRAGFSIGMRPFGIDDFISIKPNSAWFPSAAAAVNYYARDKMLLRARKEA